MKLTELSKPQLIALAIQRKAVKRVSEANKLTTVQLREILNEELSNKGTVDER